MNIHPLSAVHPDAHLGEGVQVGPFVTIDANVEIGEGTIIDAGAVIHSGARIGKNCHIHSNAVVSDIPQDLKFQGEDTITIIGDGTTVRECATIHRGESGLHLKRRANAVFRRGSRNRPWCRQSVRVRPISVGG